MEILEYFEKNDKIKNQKLDLCFSEFYMKKLCEIIKYNIELINGDSENLILRKNEFEKLFSNIEECILNKQKFFNITYCDFELLNYCIWTRIVYLNNQKEKWGETLNNEIKKEYLIACNIYDAYKNIFDKTQTALYPKRKYIIKLLNDYLEESKYNNYLLDIPKEISIHMSSKEKTLMLEKLENFLCYNRKNIRYKKDSCCELEIIISQKEIEEILFKIIKELEKTKNSIIILKLFLKEYFVLKIILESSKI